MDRLRYEIDVPKRIGITLKEFETLKKMDEFVKRFKDSNAVREYFLGEIDNYLGTDEAKKYFDTPSKKERNGSIICYHDFPYKSRAVCALYDNNTLIDKGIYSKLEESLNDIKVLKAIYNDKFYLLRTTFLKYELERIVNRNGGKSAFIRNFIAYIHNLNEDDNYAYLRSLCEICDLLQKKRVETKVTVKVVNTSPIIGLSEYHLRRQNNFKELIDKDIEKINEEEFQYMVYDYAPEYFKRIFNRAVKNNDWDRLFNEFTSEVIDLYSNYYKKGKVK